MQSYRLLRLSVLAFLCAVSGGFPGPRADEAPPQPLLPEQKEIGFIPGVPLAPHNVDHSFKTGVIDSGVRPEHPQIGNSVGAVRDFTGEGPGDPYGHGTKVVLVLLESYYKNRSVSGKMGASTPLSEIEVAKVIGRKRASAQVVADRITDAVLWLAELEARIVNISLSLPDGAADYTRMCTTMGTRREMLFMIAAGNSGEGSVVYPAACQIENKIVVGASQDGKVPEYSGPADLVAELPPAPVSPADYWYLEGAELYRSKDFAGAQRAFETGLQSHPDALQGGTLAYNLGVIALEANDEARAAARFDEATHMAPSLAVAYLGLAMIHIRAGRFEEARAALERGVAAGADSPELRERLARVFMDLDRPQDALRQMDELKRQGVEPHDLWQLRLTAENMVKIEDWIAAGQSPLLLASTFAAMDSGQLVRFIIHRWHPDLNAVPPGAAVPLLVTSATKGQRAIVGLLLESGAAVDAHDSESRLTALMMAAARGYEEICRNLLSRGANPELRDYFGFTPLTFAAEGGHATIVKLLLDRGATTIAKSKDGLDALDYARKHGHQDIAEMIVAARR